MKLTLTKEEKQALEISCVVFNKLSNQIRGTHYYIESKTNGNSYGENDFDEIVELITDIKKNEIIFCD